MSADRFPGRLPARKFFEDAVERVAPRLLGKLLMRRTRAGVIAGRMVEVEAYLGPHHETPDRAAHSHRGPTPRNQVLFGPAGHAYVYAIYGMYFCMNITCEPAGRAGCILVRALEPVLGLEAMARNRGIDGLSSVEYALPPFSQSTREGWGNEREAGIATGRGIPPFSHKTREGWGAEVTSFPPLRQKRRKDGATGANEMLAEKMARALTGGPGRLCQALAITRDAHNGLDLLDARSALQVRDDGFEVRRVLATRRIGIRHAAELPLRFCLPEHGCVSGPKTLRGRVLLLR
jgi:3-methyladenine DNA glycosylase Mpg